ncbi:MAG: winged helix-turn-helix transcriptional regulator [Betaproteobacteria bacterium]
MSPTPVGAASGAARAIALIGDAWVLRILRSAFRGTSRFGGFMQELGISRAVLSQRLESMCAQGLFTRDAGDGGHARYRLSEMGLDLWGVLILMWLWERQRGTGLAGSERSSDRPRSRLIHRDCGSTIEPRYACVHCAQTVSPFDTEAVLRPSAGAAVIGLGATSEQARYRQSSRSDRQRLPRLMRLYGDRWNCFMLAAAFQGARTFSDFERALGLGPAQISDRLSELQALGFLSARAYAGQRQEYRLTQDALATFSMTVELMQWGNRWLWRGEAPLTVRHKSCGHLLQAALDCPHCRQPLSRRNLMLSD